MEQQDNLIAHINQLDLGDLEIGMLYPNGVNVGMAAPYWISCPLGV